MKGGFRSTGLGLTIGLVAGVLFGGLMCVVHELADANPSIAIEATYLAVCPVFGATLGSCIGAGIDYVNRNRGQN